MKLKDFLFKNQSTKQTIVKNTFWLTFSEVIGRAIKAIVVIYAARVLGVEGYGVFSYALGFVGLFAIFGDIGIESLVTREVAKGQLKREKVIVSGFLIKLLLGLISYILIFFGAMTFTPIAASKILIPFLGLAIVFDSLRQFNFGILAGLQKNEIQAGIVLVNQTAAVILGLAALWFWSTPLSLAIAYALASATGLALVIYYLQPHYKNLIEDFDKEIAKRILVDSVPFAFSALIGIGLTNIDTVMLGWLSTITAVGYYSAALRPVQLLFILPMLLSWAIFPLLSKRVSDGVDNAAPLEKGLAAIYLIALPISFGGFLLADFVIKLFYGATYIASAPILKLLIFNVVLNYPATILGYGILANNQQKKTIKFIFASSLTNVVLNYFFILRWGMIGAAVATLIAQLVNTIGVYWIMYHIQKFSLWKNIWRIFLATIVMSIFIIGAQFLNVSSWLIFILAIIIYFTFLKILKEPILKDLVGVLSDGK